MLELSKHMAPQAGDYDKVADQGWKGVELQASSSHLDSSHACIHFLVWYFFFARKQSQDRSRRRWHKIARGPFKRQLKVALTPGGFSANPSRRPFRAPRSTARCVAPSCTIESGLSSTHIEAQQAACCNSWLMRSIGYRMESLDEE